MLTLTIQPSTIDSHLEQQFPDNNYGSLIRLILKFENTKHENMILKFDFSSIPDLACVEVATLSLYLGFSSAGEGNIVSCYRLTQLDWTEMGVTWNKYDGVNNWTTVGGDYTTEFQSLSPLPAQGNWHNFDVTRQIHTARHDVDDVAHFLIRKLSGSSVHWYHSKEYTTASLRPKLTIEYRVLVITPPLITYLEGPIAAQSNVNGALTITTEIMIAGDRREFTVDRERRTFTLN